jgi:threonylcarbamoyladenosine tRNA methylthiotransferase MtaB
MAEPAAAAAPAPALGPAPEVVTFGCRLNALESEVIRRHAQAAGLLDAVVVHSCAVTAEAERQARQAIRKARRARPAARIVVTGCAAQIAAGGWAAMPEVDHVVGNAEKLRPETWRALAAAADAPRVIVGDVMAVRDTAAHLVSGIDGRTRAFLEVQRGCDHRCTFCVIPYGRGPSRSIAADAIARQARLLVEAGYRELVVTGVDLTSYGRDLVPATPLGAMLREVLAAVPELPRLRLSSLDPAELDPDLLALVAGEPRLMPHLHLSVQAGDDLILKRMKRRHGRGDVIRLADRLRRLRPEIVLGADLIAGFPTEDEAMAGRSLDLLDEAGLTWLHVFPYSARAGTPAARMPQVPKELRKARAARLRAKGSERAAAFLAGEVGAVRRVLVEGDGAGRTAQFAPVRIAGPVPAAGTLADLRIVAAEGARLVGERA